MGASGWSYFEEYTKDAQVAFERLQQRVLESGDYVGPPSGSRTANNTHVISGEGAWMAEMLAGIEEGLLYADDPDIRAALESERDSMRLALGLDDAPDGWQKEVRRLRAITGADGTHSILDIERVDPEAKPPKPAGRAIDPSIVYHLGFGASSVQSHATIRVLTEEELELFFGTPTPTREDAESNPMGFDVPRWSGIAHPVYDSSGAPTHWYFAGVSGD